MDQPVFPQEFVRTACPKVAEAHDWRRNFGLPPDPDDDCNYAECAFHGAGAGLECEACDLHLTRPFLGHEKDIKWLPVLEQYYRDVKAYDKAEAKRLKEEEAITMNNGAGI